MSLYDQGPTKRLARLVLVTPDGTLLGALPPFAVEVPWWNEAASVVQGARDRFAVDITLLRLIEAGRSKPPGGEVTYLAEVSGPVPVEPWPGHLEKHRLRPRYAEVGGPAADLAWAAAMLEQQGLRPAGRPQQVRTWNLSSVWRIPVNGQTTWLKSVPAFFAHEGAVLDALAGGPVPGLLGHEGGRVLLAEIPGEDMYDAQLPELLNMVTILVDLQASWIGREPELLALGLPDWRPAALTGAIAGALERTQAALSTEERATLVRFVSQLPARFAEIAACGVPDTLVHGDFHPGNVRGTPAKLVLLDWGDSGIGHPMLDQPAFLQRVPMEHRAKIEKLWADEWRRIVPGADPERASILLAPVAAARQAVIYQKFLDNIEPSEHPYHRDDPADWLRRTAAVLALNHPA
jgi:hypothetical protein